MRPIGYYVHHQGAGHIQRARLVARHLKRPVTLLGTGLRPGAELGQVIDLPDDRLTGDFGGQDGEETRPEAFHYAPLGHDGVRDRMAMLGGWMRRHDPALVIVDVSVEVALLARLLSVPTIVVRLAGDRTDPPHLEAFRSAERLVCPFPEEFEHPGMPAWVRSRTIYAGVIAPEMPAHPQDDGRIVVLLGRGGDGPSLEQLDRAARAVTGRQWHVLGPVAQGADARTSNLHLHGWVEDVASHLAPASIVVGSGGDGVLGAVAAAGKRFVCLPEARAFREQAVKAEALARIGAAVTRETWPDAEDWPDLIAAAGRLDPGRLASLARPGAAADLARAIDGIADACEARRAAPRSEQPV